MQPQIYRIDDFMLRVGAGLMVLLVVATLAFKPWEGRDPRPAEGAYLMTIVDDNGRLIEHRDYVWSGLKTEAERIENLASRYPNALHIRPMPPGYFKLTRGEQYFLAAAVAPVALLGFGIFIRRRERRLIAIWKVLNHNIETNVGDLVANTDFTRKEIEDGVRILNQRGIGFYAWRRDTDVIEDGRLGSAYLHIENCDSCGASVGLRVPASLREVPRCEYCHSPLAGGDLNALKRDVIRDLQGHSAHGRGAAGQKPMSIGLFIFLIVVCWPAAIAYALYKSSASLRFG